MLKKQHAVVIALFFAMNLIYFSSSAQQDFAGSVGARFGFGLGITGTYNLQNNQNMEFLLRYGYHGLILNKPGANIQILYEKHWQLGRSNFTAYVGGGPSIGGGKKIQSSKISYFALGASPIVGFDYTTQRLRVPFILALDYKPTLNADIPIKSNLKTRADFSYYEIAFSVRVGIGYKRR